MLSAIKFDDEIPVTAKEVGIVWADRLLSNEFVAAKLTIPKSLPEPSFRVCIVAS